MTEILKKSHLKALDDMRHFYRDYPNADGMPLNDNTFMRYLRARNFNIEKAKKMLTGTIAWRKSFGLSEMIPKWEQIVTIENKSGKSYVRGFDKEGHAILYLRPKNQSGTIHNHDASLKNLVYNLEKTIACMDSKGKQEKLTLIIDYYGYSMRNSPPMKTSIDTLKIIQDHYPERLFRAYIVRQPWIFNAFWTAITPFLDHVTKAKIVMVKDPSKHISFNNDFDMNQVEVSVGGLDQRPFNSINYVSSPFDVDYYTLLELQGIENINLEGQIVEKLSESEIFDENQDIDEIHIKEMEIEVTQALIDEPTAYLD